jgi:hypothetical protein
MIQALLRNAAEPD